MRPRQTTTRNSVSSFISRSSHGAQLRNSSGVGLFPAARTAPRKVIHNPVSFMPSSREVALGCEANPLHAEPETESRPSRRR